MPGQPIPQDRSGPILKLGPILTGYGAQRLCAGRLEAGDSKQIAEDITAFLKVVKAYSEGSLQPELERSNPLTIADDIMRVQTNQMDQGELRQKFSSYNAIDHEAVIKKLGRLLLAKRLVERTPRYAAPAVRSLAACIVLFVAGLAFLAGVEAFSLTAKTSVRSAIPSVIILLTCEWGFINIDRNMEKGVLWLSRMEWPYTIAFIAVCVCMTFCFNKGRMLFGLMCLPATALLTAALSVAIITTLRLFSTGQRPQAVGWLMPPWTPYLVKSFGDVRLGIAFIVLVIPLRGLILREIASPISDDDRRRRVRFAFWKALE
jgi:hypothetical protein